MEGSEMKVVGIGASAGGLEAITKLFDHIPDDTGLAFIIVQHLSPDFESLMPELLSKHTGMEIITSRDKLKIEPNKIYLNERTKNLHIKEGRLYLLDKGPKSNLNLPIDILFHTLGEEYKENSIGVILSGTGSDGSRGIKTIKEEGGTILVQDPSLAQFDGMPNSAISTNNVDYIKSTKKLGKTLVKISSHSYKVDIYNNNSATSELDQLKEIFAMINRQFRIDFSVYKKATIIRRIEKRLAINSMESLQDYVDFLKESSEELHELFYDCLISVTSFFRDKEAFEVLRKDILPGLISDNLESGMLRVWVSACSTGQEAYSIAMLIDDHIQSSKLDMDFKIFASDVDHHSLNRASEGIYPTSINSEIDERLLNKYFKHGVNDYEVTRNLRKKIVFTQHDILKDPPFIRMDLISCRNMLIYFNKDSQEKALRNIQFSLNPGGVLFLGPSESLGNLTKSFKPIHNKWNFYHNMVEGRFSATRPTPAAEITLPTVITKKNYYNDPQEDNDRLNESTYHKILAKLFSPDCLIIDEEFNILYVKGDAGKKLQFTEGVFDSNLLNLVPNALVKFLRAPVLKLLDSHKEVFVENITTGDEDNPMVFDLTFTSVNLDGSTRLIVIEFSKDKESDESTIKISNIDSDQLVNDRIEQLEYQLKTSQSELRDTVEELETSNEELQSSNEELMSANEELQSTNEELQSVNEELYTVNQEFQIKNKELTQLNDDISNLLDSTDIGTLFLDEQLKIRKFTPALNQLFNLNETDIGRPITSFASNFEESIRKQMVKDAKTALSKLTTLETEVTDDDGNVFLRKVRPFVTLDKLIDGVVITFVDITSVKKIEEDLAWRTHELNRAQSISKIGSWYLNLETDELIWTDELYRMYGIDPQSTPPPYSEHKRLFSEESWKLLSASVDKAIATGTPYDLELEMILNDGSRGWMSAMGEPVRNKTGKIIGLRGVAQDISERKELFETIKYEQQFSKRISESTSMGIYIYDINKGANVYMNPHYTELLGYTMDEINAMTQEEFMSLFHPDDRDAVIEHMGTVISGEQQVPLEYRFKNKDGHWVWCYSIDSPFELDEEGNVKSFIGVFLDISEKKKIEAELKEAKQKAESANIQKNSFLANMSHEIRTPINGILGFVELLKEDDLSSEQKDKFIEIIRSNSSQLLNLIEDILDISKIEANELSVNVAKTDLPKLLKEVLANMNTLVDEKEKPDLNIKLVTPKDKPVRTIYTDGLRLTQILSNLIGNAIKFSKDGTIRFGYKVRGNMLEFKVQDQGIGMKKEQLTEIFNRFKQVYDPKDQATFGGTGLGLSICRGLVELLGGSISVDSEFGKGSAFTFTIPLQNQSTNSKDVKFTDSSSDEVDLKGKTILITDDEITIRTYYETVLKRMGVHILMATNGQEAVDLYKKNPDIDLVIMDIRMPIMGGMEATGQILEHDPDAKIIAQTAYTMNNENVKVKEAGCVDYLSKPVLRPVLLEKLDFWINNPKDKKPDMDS